MERINYVIATYAGKGTKAYIEPKEKALKIHCQRLSMFKNNLKSITIMRANDEKTKDPDNVYTGYYDIEEYIKIVKDKSILRKMILFIGKDMSQYV